MSKPKVYTTGKIRKEKNKMTGVTIDVVETEHRYTPELCKNCRKNPRNHGSSRCQECTDQNRIRGIENNRLNRRIQGK